MNKMSPNQHKFISGRSCLSQLLAHHEKILQALEHHKNMDVVYLDFSKAFDKVDHSVLLHKAQNLGIRGKVGLWLYCFLTTGCGGWYKIPVVHNDQWSTTGVSAWPLLFLMHMSDNNEYILQPSVSSFVDDTRILREVSTDEDAQLLQTDLQALYKWAEEKKHVVQ
ncbi:uncharacterized protein LOC143031623 [Oratosquilla oratoria]|uniref:uncharacterized protein LOC143031623 n=1 Tax=Oratosquilla oratoria TaxID=337810 RepID=UPI003F7642F6